MDGFAADSSMAMHPREDNRVADLDANLPTAAHPRERAWVANFAANLSAAVRPPESTLAANFSAKSNLETTFGTVVVAGRNVTLCWDAIAIPPPDQPSHLPNPFKVDNASNTSIRSMSASANNESQPLLIPNNNTIFEDYNVALASGTD